MLYSRSSCEDYSKFLVSQGGVASTVIISLSFSCPPTSLWLHLDQDEGELAVIDSAFSVDLMLFSTVTATHQKSSPGFFSMLSFLVKCLHGCFLYRSISPFL